MAAESTPEVNEICNLALDFSAVTQSGLSVDLVARRIANGGAHLDPLNERKALRKACQAARQLRLGTREFESEVRWLHVEIAVAYRLAELRGTTLSLDELTASILEQPIVPPGKNKAFKTGATREEAEREIKDYIGSGRDRGLWDYHTLRDDTGEGSKDSELIAAEAEHATRAGYFDPSDITDGRRRVMASIAQRQGQPAFRWGLLQIYGSSCAFSNCVVSHVLDAAHIVPYRGVHTNHPQNGLLLRTDLHTLFDLGLLAVDTQDMTIIVAPSLAISPLKKSARQARHVI
jgi:HNH endonuclease